MEIGNTIRSIREELGYSRKALAEQIGITQGALWKVEFGKTNAKPQTIDRFLQVSGVSRAEFYIRALGYGDIPVEIYQDMQDIKALAVNKLYRHRRNG